MICNDSHTESCRRHTTAKDVYPSWYMLIESTIDSEFTSGEFEIGVNF